MTISRGFTLIELMITIALLAVVIGIGVPSYRSTIENNDIDRVTDLVTSTLNYGKTTAMAYNSPLYMTIDDNTLIISSEFSVASGAQETLNQVQLSTADAEQVRYQFIDSPITFRSNGTLAQTNNIRYCNNSNRITYTVELSGEMTIARDRC